MTADPKGESTSSNAWPPSGLECVERCPACGGRDRRLLHDGLIDHLFGAPGRWTLYQCRNCQSAYLDPRPTRDTIGLAYQHYYTHGEQTHASKSLRQALANGYRNRAFGTNLTPSLTIGNYIVRMWPKKRRQLDAQFRGLGRPDPHAAVLDVGCGSGDFLVLARSLGWKAKGLDFDPKAVDVATSRGLDVEIGGPEVLIEGRSKYDLITLSHVIEHVHDPVGFLRQCHGLLRPGGKLWLETPNIDGPGHRLYGAHWRGLEPPRHILIFNWMSLRTALRAAGFSEVTLLAPARVCDRTFGASENIRRGLPNRPPRLTPRVRWLAWQADRRSKQMPREGEFLTVTASKSTGL